MPYILLTLAGIFWGGNYVIGHILVRNADPIILSEARWAITALLLMLLYFPLVKQNWLKIKQCFGAVSFLALCGQVLFPVTLYIGLQYTSSLNAAIYLSTAPCVSLFLNKIIFNDQITVNNVLGVILSLFGVIYLIFEGDITNLSKLSTINRGDLWAVASALSWAFYCSFLRLKDQSIPGNAFVAVSSVIGAVILLPVVIIYVSVTPVAPQLSHYQQWPFLLGLAYLVIFPSWLSYLFWNKGINDIGATRGQIFTHITPLSGGLLSIVFLNVHPHYFHLVSVIVVAIGVYLCSKSSNNIFEKEKLSS